MQQVSWHMKRHFWQKESNTVTAQAVQQAKELWIIKHFFSHNKKVIDLEAASKWI